jgi:hypothetical protein
MWKKAIAAQFNAGPQFQYLPLVGFPLSGAVTFRQSRVGH